MAAAPHRDETDRVLARVEMLATDGSGAGDTHGASPASASLLQTICPAPDTARPSSPDLAFEGPLMTGAVAVTLLHLPDRSWLSTGDRIPPGHPPAVRRALLQVYLN